MKALITGGSSGIGASIAQKLSEQGYDIILVARDQGKLEEIANTLKTNVETISTDISKTENCIALHEKVKDIDILVNSAGMGSFGYFAETSLETDLKLLDLNIKALHTLTKLFLQDFIKKDSGYILNIASTAALSPGPLMATYFASKSYVLRLTEAVHEELKQKKSNVYIGCILPGPVATHFNDQLGIQFKKAMKSEEIASIAIKGMFQKKMIMIPKGHRMNSFFLRFIPTRILLKSNYKVQIQKWKNKKNSND